MSYKDLLAVAEKDISSRNFCTLVDAAVKLYEEEEKKQKSEIKEEEEEEEIEFLGLVPKKRRSVTNFVTTRRRVPLQFHENLNGASTSSSSSLLLKSPKNPNSQSSPSLCVTEEKGRKRLAMQETNPNDKSKKAKIVSLSWKGRETPERLIQLMKFMGGDNLNLIFEKTLCETDCNPNQGRLKLPFLNLIYKDFLTLEEFTNLEKDISSKIKSGIRVILVDQRGVRWNLMLKRWETKDSWNYAFVCGWNDVVKANRFKDGVSISVWSFRCGQVLCFALFPPPTTE